jgi:hypothetical protein
MEEKEIDENLPIINKTKHPTKKKKNKKNYKIERYKDKITV